RHLREVLRHVDAELPALRSSRAAEIRSSLVPREGGVSDDDRGVGRMRVYRDVGAGGDGISDNGPEGMSGVTDDAPTGDGARGILGYSGHPVSIRCARASDHAVSTVAVHAGAEPRSACRTGHSAPVLAQNAGGKTYDAILPTHDSVVDSG